jgi:hypothetical protein
MPFRLSRRVLPVLSALALLVAACSGGGDSDDNGTGPGPTPGTPVTITLSTGGGGSASATAGGAAVSVPVTIARPAGFTGTVTLAVSAPAGITATLTPASLTGTATSSTLALTAAASLAAGSYQVTITATGNGVTTTSLVVNVTVTAAPPVPTPSYTMAVAPATVSVQAGAQGTATVTLTRAGGFEGAVALTSSGAPAGVGVAFAPASVTGSSSTATVTVGAAVAPGTYPITLRGAASGLDERTATLTLTVTAAPGGGGGSGNVTFRFCGTLAPLWLAAQDGSGAWQRITPASAGVFTFPITQARGGVAYVVSENGGFTTDVIFATQAELIEIGTSQCANSTVKSHPGTVVGGTAFDLVNVSLGGRQVTTNGPGAFTLANVPDGLRDLLAARNAGAFGGSGINYVVDRLILRRNVNLANGAALPALDFGAAEAFAPDTRTLTLTNTSGHFTNVTTTFQTANNGSTGAGLIHALSSTTLTTATSLPWYGVPAARVLAGDRHIVVASAIPALDPISSLNGRSALFFTAEPQNQTLAFGPALSGQTFALAATAPYVRPRLTYTPQAQYNRYFVLDAQHNAGPVRRNEVQMTAGYLTGATATLEVPDLSAVPGWNNDWGLKTGNQTTWTFSAVGWTGGGISGPVGVGATALSAQAGNQITP